MKATGKQKSIYGEILSVSAGCQAPGCLLVRQGLLAYLGQGASSSPGQEAPFLGSSLQSQEIAQGSTLP